MDGLDLMGADTARITKRGGDGQPLGAGWKGYAPRGDEEVSPEYLEAAIDDMSDDEVVGLAREVLGGGGGHGGGGHGGGHGHGGARRGFGGVLDGYAYLPTYGLEVDDEDAEDRATEMAARIAAHVIAADRKRGGR